MVSQIFACRCAFYNTVSGYTRLPDKLVTRKLVGASFIQFIKNGIASQQLN